MDKSSRHLRSSVQRVPWGFDLVPKLSRVMRRSNHISCRPDAGDVPQLRPVASAAQPPHTSRPRPASPPLAEPSSTAQSSC
jgi:hypothetical protein